MRDSMATEPETLDTLRRRVEALERVCAEAYQLAGVIGAPVRVLDNLAAAADGLPLPHDSFLPIALEDCDAVRERPVRLGHAR